MALVIAATSNVSVNQCVAAAAAAAGCLVNVVDQPDLSNFISPAIVDRSPLVIAVSSGGAMPVLATRVRAWLENLLPDQIGALAHAARQWRKRVAGRLPDLSQRRHFWNRLLDRALADRAPPNQLIEQALATSDAAASEGVVYLVGAGPGDPDLLTLKAARILQQADVILYDRLVAPEILERARRDAEFVNVGKAAGAHRFSQAHINRLLIEYAQRGLMVCRLKGGDPGLFGRAGEEIDALRKANIDCHLVPGITAAQGCAAAAGFSLTDRRHAHSLLLATAHGADDTAVDLAPVTAGQTAAYYMPIKSLPRLTQRLRKQGLDGATPCAIIENGTRDGQRVIRGELRYIDELAAQANVQSPALLITGYVTDQIDRRAQAESSQCSEAIQSLNAA